MKRINLSITAQAPLAIGQRKPGGSVSEAMDYIPGAAIRGAIAARILEQSATDPALNAKGSGDDFQKLFLDEHAAIFQNAYPAIARVGDDCYKESLSVCLLPTTALSSKTNAGFKPKGGVFDSLIDGFCARAQGLFYEPNDLQGDRVEPFGGFYSRKDKTYHTHTVSKRLLTRVGINRRRATAQEEILYSIEVMDEVLGRQKPQSMIYRSSIVLRDDDLANQLQLFIQLHQEQFRFGGSASRGLGRVNIETNLEDLEDQTGKLEKRISSFNQAMQQRWDLWGIFGAKIQTITNKTFFTLNLQSDAILTDNWLHTITISENMLRQFVQMQESDDPTLKLQTAYNSYDYRSGWNAAWGLQKDVELVTKMGGVYLFSTENPQLWYSKLAELELSGAGDRTHEGFGQIKVCDDFHLIFRENAV
jgi:CRISPR-associated protein Csx10